MAVAQLTLLALVLLVLLWLALRRADTRASERLERELRDEIGRQAQGARSDLAVLQQAVLTHGGETARTQNEQIDALRQQLALTQQHSEAALRRFGEVLAEQLRQLTESHERRQAEMRQAVESRLQSLQEGNEKKLEQMRATVDEKLQSTLEQRLGESFKLVADRLEQVHRGLGEMQGLARDVGSLNRVLLNVKTRGTFGEVQLAALLEQVFTPEQYASQVVTRPGSSEKVDFAIRLPGRREDGAPLWLPIDAKFPRDDYERLVEAQERADRDSMEAAANAIEARLRTEARAIRSKYIAAPHTTDFAILFVPTEGLYAEALRRPGLVQALQTEHRVMLAGPTTLLATLNSLQMGFRTLAIEQRSAEVWQVLGAVKTEFGKFGDVLALTKKKLAEASRTIESAETRTRVMARQLKGVEALPDPRVRDLFGVDELPDGTVPGGDAAGG
ncbi:MAG: DNA recombination protein RmuC [Ideonella sp.]|nr:DNA recombination protein RmuC [Ideonella sp.]